jgi:hypothetical protein
LFKIRDLLVCALPETSYEIKIYTNLRFDDLFTGMLHGYVWQKNINAA